jgi:hypothetical protein
MISLIQNQTFGTSGSSPASVALSSPPTVGNYLHVFINANNFGLGSVSGITCTNTSGWAQIPSASVANGTVGTINMFVWRGLVGASASSTIVVSGSFVASEIIVAEFSGLSGNDDATTPVGNTGATGSPTIGSFTNSTSGSLLFAAAVVANGDGSPTGPGAPWASLGSTAGVSAVGIDIEYQITSSIAAQSISWSGVFSGAWASLILGQTPNSGGLVVQPRLMMMGIGS